MSNIKKKNIENNIDKKIDTMELKGRAIVALIDRGLETEDIPEGLKPESMMAHIMELKNEGYFGERKNVVGKAEAEFSRRKRIRVFKRMGIAVASVALFCVVMFVPFGELGYKENPYGSYQAIVDNVRAENDAGEYILSGYKELSQYLVASSTLEYKPPEVFESLYDKIASSFILTSESSADSASSEDWSGGVDYMTNTSGSTEYSDTNVRTEGVSEADVIKTDGQYIYYIDDDFGRIQLVIAKADGENTAIVSKTEIEYELFKPYSAHYSDGTTRFSLSELFIDEDKIIVIMSGYITEKEGYDSYMEYSTLMLVYDTNNIAEPKLVSDFKVDGVYESSRMVDGYVYLFTYDSIDGYMEEMLYTEETAEKLLAPHVNGETIKAENMYIAGNDNYGAYKIIVTLDTDNPSELKEVKAVLGDGRGLTSYVSNEYIYFMSGVYNGYTEKLDDNDVEYIAKEQIEILKFDYEEGTVKLVDKALVNGTIGDEFDIDEYNGYLRMAVTVENIYFQPVQRKYTFFDGEAWYDFDRFENHRYYADELKSQLYVLDEELDVVGELTLQIDESIYGVRYDGDTAYVVTFRETDPLFSVDLSEPTEPKIMGILKIPGFSEYIHKWDENTLVGIGYVASVGNRVKISTFDISDKYDIIEKDVCELPTNGWSEAPNNHKEIFISPEKNLIGMWMAGRFITDNETSDAVYVMYSYVDGQLTQIIKCPLADSESANKTRGMYIGDYIYIVNVEEGVFVYSMDNYSQLVHAK